MSDGFYEPSLVRAWKERGWSIEDAEREARSHPDYGDEIRRIDVELHAMAVFPSAVPEDVPRQMAELVAQKRSLVQAVYEDGEVPAEKEKTGHRLRDELPLAGIDLVVDELEQRKIVMGDGRRAPKEHSYEAIAARVSKKAKFRFTKDRVRDIDRLVEIGWDVRKSHPSFSAQRGYVILPTPREAVLLLRIR